MPRILKALSEFRRIKVGQVLYLKFPNNVIVKAITKHISRADCKKLLKGSHTIAITLDSINIVNQGTHPDIFVSKNVVPGKYVLTMSGYPFNLAQYEDQYVLLSDDGLHFKNVLGNNKAIAAYEGNGISHFSDGDILEVGKTVYLYYRMCYEDVANPYITIFCRSTNDFKKWSNEEVVITRHGITFISPSIIYYEKRYIMFFVNYENGAYYLYRSEATNPLFKDSTPEKVELLNAPSNRNIWHLDVVSDGDKLYGLFVFAKGYGGHKARLFEAISYNKGLSWNIGFEIKLDIDYSMVNRIYRSSMIKNGDSTWDIYIPVRTKKDSWFLLLKENYSFTFDL